MKTTLKRGIGRGANGNGNGRAILPPGSLSPVTLYRQAPPPKPGFAKLVGRFFLYLALVLVVLVSGLVGGFYLWAHEKAYAFGCQSARCEHAAQRLDKITDPSQPAIALVIGYDHRAGDGADPSRSDTLMLIRADPATKTVSLLSLPRDLDVPIYCPSRTSSGRNGPAVVYDHGRINSAYAFCGPTGSLETVRHLTGLPINYLINVNFFGFIAVVDRLGGVWMDVDRRYYNRNVGTTATDFANINLQPGYQLLNGREALSFVRYRHTDSDLFRLARQQEFVSALREQASHSLGPSSVISLVNKITDHHYIEVGVGGGRHVDLGLLKQYATFAHGLPPGHVFQNRIQGLTGYNELSASQSSIDEAVQSFLNPDVQSAAQQTAVALGRKVHKKFTLPPSKVTLTVLNGNGVAGSAANASYLLAQKDYKILLPPSNQPANAPNWNYFHSKAYYDTSRGACKGAAQGVAKLVGSTDVGALPAKLGQTANGACVVLIVGSTFHNRLAPSFVQQAPTHHAPVIRHDPNATRSTLAAVKRRVHFQLQLPTVLERSSNLDTGYSETPIRVYSLGGRPSVRLTYRTGTNEYWGVQETDWNDPPVFGDRSLSQTVGGRHYDLFYTGSNLHMVVLRSGNASYWVVNTLLDSLSNETMLSIARGLRPMSR
jgi:LCP family protein required for cell wall assembly